MSDYKTRYSLDSIDYIENEVQENEIDQRRYERSKLRETEFNDDWIQHKVNLNEIVDRFIPDDGEILIEKTQGGIKYVFEGERYIVKCDKVAGYLRIYDKILKSYCTIDGTPSRDNKKTHMKIMAQSQILWDLGFRT